MFQDGLRELVHVRFQGSDFLEQRLVVHEYFLFDLVVRKEFCLAFNHPINFIIKSIFYFNLIILNLLSLFIKILR